MSRTNGFRSAVGALFLAAALPLAVPAGASEPAGDPADDPVVIRLGDEVVTRSELDARFDIAARLLAKRQGVSLAGQDPGVIATLREQYLDKRATELVLLREARRRQLVVSDAQVDAAFGELFADEQELDALLAGSELGQERARALLERVVRDEQTVELLTEHMLREIKVPPGDVITMHHDVKHALATPEAVCVRHIQVADRESAEALRAELLAGADFAALARQNSTDQASAVAGGDLGCFERGPAGPRTDFEKAAFSAGEGEITGPVESRFGYHLLVVYEHRMPREPTLNEAYTQIERELALEELPQRIQALIEKSDIKVYPDRFS